MKYRKKPVIIEAHQWDGTYRGMNEIESKFPKMRLASRCCNPLTEIVYHWKISTLEGSSYVSKGDFVIRGIEGEFYPCKPEIFEKTYEPDDTAAPSDVTGGGVKKCEYYKRAHHGTIDNYTNGYYCSCAGDIPAAPPGWRDVREDELRLLAEWYRCIEDVNNVWLKDKDNELYIKIKSMIPAPPEGVQR
jgi:hypothetical protein